MNKSVLLAAALAAGNIHAAEVHVGSAESTVLERPGKGLAWGYQGDGSTVMQANPPLKFDANQPVWRAALPSYGHASPVVVEDRVFVLCEPDDTCPWPRLVCLNNKDGQQFWVAELNHLPATTLTEAQQAEANKHWGAYWRKFLLFRQYRAELAKDPTRKDELQAKLNEIGVTGNLSATGYCTMKFADLAALTGKYSPLSKAGISVDTWTGMGGYGAYVIGEAFATPTSDGKYLYAVTPYGGFFCFTFDGKVKWLKHYPGLPGEYCRNGRSPLIYRNLLISDMTALMRAIDCETGSLLWSAPVDGEAVLSPTVVRMKDGDAVLCGKGQAFLLPSGKPLTVTDYKDFGMTALTKYDEPDVVFFTGGGEHGNWTAKGYCPTPPPAAVRFALDGDKLQTTVLWNGINGKRAGSHSRIAYYEGKLFTPHGIADAETGKLLGAAPPELSALRTGHLIYVANGHLFGLRCASPKDKPAEMRYLVSTLDGKVLSDSVLPGYTYSSSFTVSGECAYIRTSTHLWCMK